MLWVAVIALVLVGAGTLAVSRHRQAKRLADRGRLLDRLRRAVERRETGAELGPADAGALVLSAGADRSTGAGGRRVSLPWADLAPEATADQIVESLLFRLHEDTQPHDAALQLNVEAPALGLRLVHADSLTAFPDGPPPAIGVGDTDLRTLFVFRPTEESPGLTYLSRRSLEETGLDDDGLQGALLAMLRQELDEEPIRALVETGGAVAIDQYGASSAACLLLLPEVLEADEELFALVCSAGRLVLTDATRLEDTVRSEEASRARETWLLQCPVRVREGGIRLAEAPVADC